MRVRPWLVASVATLLLAPGVRGEEPAPPPRPPDRLAEALDAMGIGPEDLGYRPRGTWARYPQPATVPHVLPFFPDLLARPLDTYEFTRTLGNAVEDLLTPEALTRAPDEKDRRETLFKLGVTLGTDRRIGGFRGYSANLDPRPDAHEPLLHALLTLLERAGTPLRSGMAFGQPPSEPTADPLAALTKQVGGVPTPLHTPLARYVLNLIDAHEWIDRGLRHVTKEQREQVFATLRTLTEDTPDGTRYFPVLDDVARVLDEHSLHYGCLKALQATQDARRELGALTIADREGVLPKFDLRIRTGWGTLVFTTVAHERVDDPLVLVTWFDGPVYGSEGATGPLRSLSIALLMQGASHLANDATGHEADEVASLASGILGCGILYSAGVKNDTYEGGAWGMGAGLFGLGALIDEGGDDSYQARAASQGAAFFGAGLLLDAAGNDRYELREGDGQGFGGPGGIGILADRSGDDTYVSEPDAAKAGRADYHSENKVAVSNAQGVGSGRRGDGSDGHAWAGGLGALLDVDGDDAYQAGNFSQGLGYWYGTGLLWDGGGNDRYTSVYFTQGSGAHFAVGALIDEGGDDVHHLEPNAGAAFGFGWDVVNALLLDRGSGNDRYEARILAYGLGEVRSNGLFLDEGGDDTYVLDAGAQGLGDVDQRPEYAAPGRTTTFPFHLAQVGLFLDLGGKDTYLRRAPDDARTPDPEARDDATWRVRRRERASSAGPNVSLGRDAASGRLGFLDPWPARVPPPRPPGAEAGK